MKLVLWRFGAFLLSVVFISCAQTHCRRATSVTPPVAPDVAASGAGPVSADTNSKRTVWVYKYDGSLQCGQGKPASVEEMAKELSGLKILKKQKRPDGMMHIQVCGSTTGQTNAYEILESDLSLAEKRGFKKWAFE